MTFRNPLLEKIYVFRPLPEMLKGKVWRYAEGKWVPDDGEPDLAFISDFYAFFVDLPDLDNILWSWWDEERQVWHYHVLNPKKSYGDRWGIENHPNYIAGREAMRKCCEIFKCANGTGPYIHQPNEYIDRSLLWIKHTMEPVVPPEAPVCFKCTTGLHEKERLEGMIAAHTAEIFRYKQEIRELKRRISSLQELLRIRRAELKELRSRK